MRRLVARGVSKSFVGPNGAVVRVLNNLDLMVPEGTFTTLMGVNGSGKTTLLRILSGFVVPDEGEVHVTVSNGDQRARIGMVWQDYRASLLPWRRVEDNIGFPLLLRGSDRGEVRERVRALLGSVGLEQLRRRWCYELSGGQQQIVSILRGLVMKPDVLFFDEAFSALDPSTRWQVTLRVQELWGIDRPPTLFVSHDVDEAVLLGDQILLLNHESGRIDDVVRNPLPRPRTLDMLVHPEHERCRREVINHLFVHQPGDSRSSSIEVPNSTSSPKVVASRSVWKS